MSSPHKQFFNWLQQDSIREYVLYIGAGIGIAGAIYGARWYFSGQAGRAQKVYAEAANQFSKGSAGMRGAWQDLEFMARIGYEHHPSSVFGPYFLGLEAEAQVQQHKQEEAIKTMDKMVSQLSGRSPLYSLYKTKRALMKLDAEDASTKQEGLAELEQLASDKNNSTKDQAQYYLGLYYWVTGERQKAEEKWTTLVADYGVYEGEKASPWAQLAESKISAL